MTRCRGKRDSGFQFRLFHGLTTETETSCFYQLFLDNE
jgi:hypothetical protein